MSGGHFNYDQFRIAVISEGVRELIDENDSNEYYNYSPETVAEFKKALYYLEMARLYAHRIDWLVSGDDGEDTFHRLMEVEKKMIGEENEFK